jgi:HNH endonuclease
MRRSRKEVERFEAKIVKGGPLQCWSFRGCHGGTPLPYQRFSIKRRGKWLSVWAHIYAYELSKGPRPRRKKRVVVRHTCDNPRCVNPAHLILGTYRQNTHDSIRRGRWPTTPRSTKLSIDEADQVVRLWDSGNGMTQTAIGRMLGVTQAAISLICCGKNWRKKLKQLAARRRTETT